jgi:uncharacterized protein YfaS (alpha-2-macroglobulin family)
VLKEKRKKGKTMCRKKMGVGMSSDVIVAVCIFSFFIIALTSVPALASDFVYGTGGVRAVICAEAKGYKDYVPHHNNHFPPGSTVKIYVEASGKTKEDTITGEYIPKVQFKMSGTRPTGASFSGSGSSRDDPLNHDRTLYKNVYGIISFSIPKNAVEGRYKFKIEAFDNNKDRMRIGQVAGMTFYVNNDATLYPPINYTYSNLTIEPNPADVGTTVTVSVNVTNLGGKGNWKGETVYLDVDGMEIKAVKTLKLANNENETLIFKLTRKELGEGPKTFNVSIGGLNETLEWKLKEKGANPNSGTASKPTGEGGAKTKVPGFSIVYAVAAFVALFLFKKRFVR